MLQLLFFFILVALAIILYTRHKSLTLLSTTPVKSTHVSTLLSSIPDSHTYITMDSINDITYYNYRKIHDKNNILKMLSAKNDSEEINKLSQNQDIYIVNIANSTDNNTNYLTKEDLIKNIIQNPKMIDIDNENIIKNKLSDIALYMKNEYDNKQYDSIQNELNDVYQNFVELKSMK